MQISTETPSSTPPHKAALKKGANQRYYLKHRAKILENKKKKAGKGKLENLNELSYKDERPKDSQGGMGSGEQSWGESRSYERAPVADPRLDEPARLRTDKPARPSLLSVVQAKSVSLFKKVADHSTGGLCDKRVPDC